MASDSTYLFSGPCPRCGSSDANAHYDDGHTFCFSCNAKGRHDGGEDVRRQDTLRDRPVDFLTGEVTALAKRGISAETCRKYGYLVGRDENDRIVQIAQFRDASGALIAQKLRYADKTFKTKIEKGDVWPLFGQHLWAAGGKRLVITEGEIDAMSVAQVFGLTWPAVSIPNGATSAAKTLKTHYDYVTSFDEVVLAFDMDDVGRQAAADCALLLPPGKAKIAEFPLKDANELLQAGRGKDIMTAIYQARTFRPDGIVSLDDIEERVLKTPTIGRPWPFPLLTQATFGRRLGEVYGFGAGTGVGKTDLFTECIAHDVLQLGAPTGVIYLEQSVGETGRRIAGKVAARRFHVPDGSWTEDELKAAWAALKGSGKLHLYDHWGAMDWQTVKSRIRYMVAALGCEHIYLDHLTALAAAEEDERKALEKIMAEAASMAQELKFILHYVSHLATPEGKPHEEGGRVMIRHFKGSRALGFWSHGMFGLERNQQAETAEERSITRLRCLKDSYTGQATGKVFELRYSHETGKLTEVGEGQDVPDTGGEF